MTPRFLVEQQPAIYKDGGMNECSRNWVVGEIKELLNAICIAGNQVRMNSRYTCPEFRGKVRT